MTTSGWLIMTVSVGSVTALFLWCIWRVLRAGPADPARLHGFEIETPDEKASRQKK